MGINLSPLMRDRILVVLLVLGVSAAILRLIGFREYIPNYVVPLSMALYFSLRFFTEVKR